MTEEKIKILTLDIETSPAIAYTWAKNMYETDLTEIIEPGKIICFSAKWLNGKKQTKAICDYSGYKSGKIDDKQICVDICKFLDCADVVVTQNGVAFDTKYVTARCVANDILPPSPFKNIDTYTEAKKLLKLPSHSLNEMAKYFNIGKKMEHEGFSLWKKCISGDSKAWNRMKKYNAQDVELTEKLYLKLRPFMKNHPNLNYYSGKKDCPKCGSSTVHLRGFAVNSSGKFQRAQCQNCGGWFQFGKAISTIKHIGKNL